MTTYAYSLDVIQRQDPKGLEKMPSESEYIVNPPSITFSDRMTFTLGKHTFELYYTPGHSDANISVFVPEEKVVFVGDTVFSECQTWLHTCDPDALFESLRFLQTLDADYVVPGHGPVVTKDYLYKQAAVLYEWLENGRLRHGQGLEPRGVRGAHQLRGPLPGGYRAGGSDGVYPDCQRESRIRLSQQEIRRKSGAGQC